VITAEIESKDRHDETFEQALEIFEGAYIRTAVPMTRSRFA